MESTQNIKKEKKKGLSFTSITSDETKRNILKLLNDAIERSCNENGIVVSLIPTNPTPNISFWVSEEEKRCGITITRENAKYGWRISDDGKIWVPCAYMNGMSMDLVVFSNEENSILFDILFDHCKKYKYIVQLSHDLIK